MHVNVFVYRIRIEMNGFVVEAAELWLCGYHYVKVNGEK